MNASVIGIDLSKNVFHIVAKNHSGKVVDRQKARRDNLLTCLSKYGTKALVCMEACQGAHHWCRTLQSAGFDARQVAAQHVKPYCPRQKNDYNDASAIAEVGSRKETNFVPSKSVELQELEAAMNVRRGRMKERTAVMNQARGLLAEQGKVLARTEKALRVYLHSDMDDIPVFVKQMMIMLREQLAFLNEQLSQLDKLLHAKASQNEVVKRVMTIPGIGIFTAVALVTISGNHKEFKNGRQFAAFLGLVPRQHSTGGKTRLGRITKNGDSATRSLLVLGGFTTLRYRGKKEEADTYSLWIRKLREKNRSKLAAVAIANKHARIAWRIITTPGLEFDSSLAGAAE